MRYIGIDYGSKRVGVARSDERGVLAFPHAVLPNDARLIDDICTIARDEGAKGFVVGTSVNLQGGTNPIEKDIEEFITRLSHACPLAIHRENELYSTQAAARVGGTSDHIDASAAAILLQSFLDRARQHL